ncbi:GFA family protein [Rhizobium sp. G187]|uniref:GFA family protein n=1 Tax=Rhizobium sp. G187 TaxID=3451352 RepID=UPI003EE78DF4
MGKTYSGGCACSRLRYAVQGEPAIMLDCQCRQCQRDSGTGHQSHMTFVNAEVTLEGEPSHWPSVGDGGTVKQRAFCPVCGSAVWMTFPAMPQVFIVTPASLDDPALYAPQMTTWTKSGQPFDPAPPHLPSFECMPPA